jgi:hypothetical protein
LQRPPLMIAASDLNPPSFNARILNLNVNSDGARSTASLR